MNDITMLVDQAIAQWQEETDCGATDPAFGGEIGEDIDKLVDGLSDTEKHQIMKATAIASSQPLKGRTRIINGIWLGEIGIVEESTDGCFTLICNRCGESVSITPKNASNHLQSYGYKHYPEKGGELRVESADDTHGPIIACPCGNQSYDESGLESVIEVVCNSYGPSFIDDDDPNIADE